MGGRSFVSMMTAFGVPFFAGGGLKVIYDVVLFAGFRNRRASHGRG